MREKRGEEDVPSIQWSIRGRSKQTECSRLRTWRASWMDQPDVEDLVGHGLVLGMHYRPSSLQKCRS